MTEPDIASLVAAVADQLWLIGGGFGIEIVLAFPVVDDSLDEPVIASAGSRDRVLVEPAQVFRYAIRRSASGVVLGHNHPADTGPSEADRAVTRRLISAGHVLGIPLLAHIVVEPGAVHDIVSGRSWSRDAIDRDQPRTPSTNSRTRSE